MNTAQATAFDLSREIPAAQKGDQGAFARIVDATRSTVCSIALATVGDVPRSEDVAQEVLVAAWRGLPRLRDPASFWPWLRQLTRNQARQHLRASGRRQRRFGRGPSDEALAAVADPAVAADEALAGAEAETASRTAFRQALEELPDEGRELVILFYREGQSIRQVAELLGIAEATAKKRLQRARDQVRQSVLERLGETARATAPGALFTASVLSAVAAAAPSTAAAAGLGLGGKVLVGAKLLPIFGATLPGFLVGSAGILLPMRKLLREALDDEERRHIVRVGVIGMVAMTTFCGLVMASLFTRRAAFMVGGFALMQGTFFALFGVALPRITRRRFALERERDPAAARRQARQRLWSLFGLFAGGAIGGFAVWQSAHFLR